MKKLTEKQKKLYHFIYDYGNYNPPTYRQMRNFMNVKSNQTVADHLLAIKKKGYELPYPLFERAVKLK